MNYAHFSAVWHAPPAGGAASLGDLGIGASRSAHAGIGTRETLMFRSPANPRVLQKSARHALTPRPGTGPTPSPGGRPPALVEHPTRCKGGLEWGPLSELSAARPKRASPAPPLPKTGRGGAWTWSHSAPLSQLLGEGPGVRA